MSNETNLTEAEEYAKVLEDAGILEKDAAPEAVTPEPAEAGDEATGADAPDPVAAEAPQAEEEELFPGFNALPAEAQAAVRERIEAAEKARIQAENQWKAQHGQLAPTQRELQQARRQVADMNRQLEEIKKAKTNGDQDDLIAKFKEQYPDEGAALEAISKQFGARTEELQREVESAKQAAARMQQAMDRQAAVQTLSQRHADWQEIDSSDTFKEWLKHASLHKRALAASPNPDDVADLIDDYKRDVALAQALAAQQQAAPARTRKPEADPSPTQRQSSGGSATNASSSSEAEEHVAVLQAYGYDI